MPVKSNLKDKLEDDVLDLSLMQLDRIPVKDIAPLTKGTTLDLSNNLLTSVPESFSTLTHLVKLDLSKNQITELPEYFGNLHNLRHLDLYSNQLERLPISFSQLKNLKWLDLKNNPLVPALRQAAGPCITNVECTTCAKKVVALFHSLQTKLENEKKLWVLEEKKTLQRRLESEKAEKERLKAEKKAAASKRRQEVKENGEEMVKAKSGSPSSGSEKGGPSHQGVRKKEKSLEESHRETSSNFSSSLFMKALYLLFVLGATGASVLYFYTEGDLSQKSIVRALPLIRHDAESAMQLTLNKLQTSAKDLGQWTSEAWSHSGEKLQAGWKEFLRRNDVLAQYVNKHYGPYFCSFKKRLFQQFTLLQGKVSDFNANTILPSIHEAQKVIWPYVDFLTHKARDLMAFIRSALE